MNLQKFFIAFVICFIFMFAFGFIWYAKLLHGVHVEVPALWREGGEAGPFIGWLVLGHIVMAFFFTLFVARYIPAGSAAAGAKFGLMVALVIAGALVGAIYRPSAVTNV